MSKGEIFGDRVEKIRNLDHVAIDVDLVAVALLLERFGQHEFAHPVDALVAALDCEMMRLARRGAEHAFLLRGRDELETEGGGVAVFLFLAAELEGFEGGAQFVGGEGRAGDGVVVDVDVFEGVHGFGVLVHGQAGAIETEMVLVPLVAEHFRPALLHPAGVVDAFDVGRGEFFRVVCNGGEGVVFF